MQDQDVGIGVQGPGERDPLSLAPGQVPAALPDRVTQAVGEILEDLRDRRGLQDRLGDGLLVVVVTHGDVRADGAHEQVHAVRRGHQVPGDRGGELAAAVTPDEHGIGPVAVTRNRQGDGIGGGRLIGDERHHLALGDLQVERAAVGQRQALHAQLGAARHLGAGVVDRRGLQQVRSRLANLA